MTAHSLHIDLPDANSSGVWPWIIALLACACMLLVVAQKLQSIPASLQQKAQLVVENSGFDSLTVAANGRDLSLTGDIAAQQSVAALISEISQINGVRRVRDELSNVDIAANSAKSTEQILTLLSRIHTSSVAFQPGNAAFAPSSTEALSQIARLLIAYPAVRIRIEGHTDNTGPESVNLRLSRERAQAVVDYLINQGIAADRLISKGYGSTQPIDTNNSDIGRSRNRRIEISYIN